MSKSTTVLWHSSVSKKFKMSLLGSTVLGLLFSTGCASTATTTAIKTHHPVAQNPNVGTIDTGSSNFLDASALDSLESLLSATDMRAVEGDRLLILKHGDVWKRMTVGFKMDETKYDPRIEAQRSWFISRQPYLDRMSARASRYLYHTVKEAERRGMPTELALLPVIESSYDPSATSSAAAAGLWQFIPSTGRIYGLQQTNSYDARRDVVESTRAAYEFLGTLYNQFGSWELALAAYNAGPGRVQQAINRNAAAGLPTDYWSLKLPQETMSYVPRFLAVAQIIKDPKAYGVTLPPIANRPHFREIQVNPGVSLLQIAELTGLSRAELSTLNPGYRGDFIDIGSPGRVLVPSDLNLTVDQRLKALKGTGVNTTVNTAANSAIKPIVIAPMAEATVPKKVIPKSADGLAAFANNADVPSAPRIPVAVTTASDVKKPINVEPPISNKERENIISEIKADDAKETVNGVIQPVANKLEQQQVVSEIKAIAPKDTEIVDPYDGKIKLTAIQTSQSVADSEGKEVTKVFANSNHKESSTALNNDNQPKGVRSTYVVAPGDTLAVIAAKNAVSWKDIAKWNQIDPNAALYVGNVLYLYNAKPQVSNTAQQKPDVYIVKVNDSLTALASQYDLSVKDLAAWNDLSTTSNLMVGQKLLLKAPKETSVANKPNQSKFKTTSYTVKKGESLTYLAERYDLSSQELAELTPNLTTKSALMVGQKINVPVVDTQQDKPHDLTRVQTELYKVQRQETFAMIADKFDLSIAELAKINQVKANHTVKVGQIIKVPKVEQPEEYVVQRGDTLASIAAKFNLQVSYLARLNGISVKTAVRTGHKLKLVEADSVVSKQSAQITTKPQVEQVKKSTSTRATESYTVRGGDSFNSIAKRYDLTVKELAEINNISAKSMLLPGQSLDVPKKTISYKVKSGDNWTRLAAKYELEPKELAEMNDTVSSKPLRIGIVIQVPNK